MLSQDETRWLLEQRWNHLGIHIRVDDFTDTEALAAIVRITGGNFRVIHLSAGKRVPRPLKDASWC